MNNIDIGAFFVITSNVLRQKKNPSILALEE